MRKGRYSANFRMFHKIENMQNFVLYCFSKRISKQKCVSLISQNRKMGNFVSFYFAKQKTLKERGELGSQI
jgi:hypothetical protein